MQSISALRKVPLAARPLRPILSRGFAGGPVPTEGIEGMVRKFLPKDEHVVLGISGFYLTLYGLSKIGGGGKKEEAPAAAPVSIGTSTNIPSIADEKFSEWAEIPGNMEKWVDSLEKSAA